MIIKPFRGIRPPKTLVEKVSSRPYDVLNSEEARREAEGNPMSLYHIIKPEINFEPARMSTTRKYIPVLWSISASSAKRAGWCRTRRTNTMSMRRQ